MLCIRRGTLNAHGVRLLSSTASAAKTARPAPFTLVSQRKKDREQQRSLEERDRRMEEEKEMMELDKVMMERERRWREREERRLAGLELEEGGLEEEYVREPAPHGPVRDPAPHVGREPQKVDVLKARSREEFEVLFAKAKATTDAPKLPKAKVTENAAVPPKAKVTENAAVLPQAKAEESTDAADIPEVNSTGASGEAPLTDGEVREAFAVVDAAAHVVDSTEASMGVRDKVRLTAKDVPIMPVKPPRDAPIARLGRDLEKVLFSPGVHLLRDPRTGVWNFDKGLGNIPTPEEFAFNRLPQYITASEDDELAKMGEADGLKYMGSTSTLTQSLSQVYFAMNGGRGVDISTLSASFGTDYNQFTAGAQLPAIITLKFLPNGRYAIDNDKRYSIDENILSDYGRILEKLLTSEPDDFARFMISAPESAVSLKERTDREAYCYSRSSSLLMRSQLDCQDNRLPGSGTFDIKTRACFPIRNDRANYKMNSLYDISEQFGQYNSFEREYFDLTRSGMLKYCFQARIGQMDGIFVAYHNTVRCFGFQYLPLSELDQRLFGSTEAATQVFSLCVGVLERILKEATSMFPGQEISLTISHDRPKGDSTSNILEVTAQALEQKGDAPKATRAMRFKFKNRLDGELVGDDGIDTPGFSEDPEERKNQEWGLDYELQMSNADEAGHKLANAWRRKHVKSVTLMNRLYVPEGFTPACMMALDAQKRTASSENGKGEKSGESETAAAEDKQPIDEPPPVTWVMPNDRIAAIRLGAKLSGEKHRKRMAQWDANPGSWWDGEKGVKKEVEKGAKTEVSFAKGSKQTASPKTSFGWFKKEFGVAKGSKQTASFKTPFGWAKYEKGFKKEVSVAKGSKQTASPNAPFGSVKDWKSTAANKMARHLSQSAGPSKRPWHEGEAAAAVGQKAGKTGE